MEKTKCIVCTAILRPTDLEGVFHHGDAICTLNFVDENGNSLDHLYHVVDGNIYMKSGDWTPGRTPPMEAFRAAQLEPFKTIPIESASHTINHTLPISTQELMSLQDDGIVTEEMIDTLLNELPIPYDIRRRRKQQNIIDLSPFKPMEECIAFIFESYGLPVLGGTSGEMGWTANSIWQRCPYLFKRVYIDGQKLSGKGLDVGTVFHAFSSVHYMKMIDSSYPLTPQLLHQELLKLDCNQIYLEEARRVWAAYECMYENDYIEPLAVELLGEDPVTRNAARFDLICRVTKAQSDFPAGIYIMDHKTAAKFDYSTMEGRAYIGTVKHQMCVYEAIGLKEKFGKLQGVILNLCGKQKVPKFHRQVWIFTKKQINEHKRHLQMWDAQRRLALLSGTFLKARANCVGAYGSCSQWDHCLDN